MNFLKKFFSSSVEKDKQKPEEYNDRLKKLKDLKNNGFVFKSKFNKTHFTKEVVELDTNSFRKSEDVMKSPKDVVSVAGRVITKRDHGGILFFDIQDMKGNLQIAFTEEVLGEKLEEIRNIDTGDFIGISGEPFITKRKTLAVLCKNFSLLSKALLPLPTQHFGIADTEIRYRKRYIDLIVNEETKNRFLVRSKVVESMRQFLLSRDFIEVVTRSLQPVAGGAMAKTFQTYYNALHRDFSLRISNELDLKMAVAGGLERVFEFAIDFRNEGIDPSHLQEFQMLEWYLAYEDFNKGIEMTEEMMKKAVLDSLGTTKCEIFDPNDKKHSIDFSKKMPVVKYADLLSKNNININADIKELQKIADSLGVKNEGSEFRSRGNLLDDIYKKKIRPTIIEPTFITHLPSDTLPLARVNDEDKTLSDSYQLVIASWEILKGYSELVDPMQQEKAFEEQMKDKTKGDSEAMEFNREFLTAMEHGMPPITGWGMGIDRFVTLITGEKNIKETVLFPHLGKE